MEKDPEAQDDVVGLTCVKSRSAILKYQGEFVYEVVILLVGKKVLTRLDFYSAVSVCKQDTADWR